MPLRSPAPFALSHDWQLGSSVMDDGTVIRWGRYQKGSGDKSAPAPTRAILLLNGRGEFIEKYDYLVEDLNLAPETLLLTIDHRGQGKSGGERAWVVSYERYAQDLKALLQELCPGLPYWILAHSMGGLIAAYSTSVGLITPQGMAFSAPFLGMPAWPLPPQAATWLARTVTQWGGGEYRWPLPALAKTPFLGNPYTSSKERFARMSKSPYDYPGVTFRWLQESAAAMERIHSPEGARTVQVPVLLMPAGGEGIVHPKGCEQWATTLQEQQAGPVQLCPIPGGKHELFSESPDPYHKTLQCLRDWVTAQQLWL